MYQISAVYYIEHKHVQTMYNSTTIANGNWIKVENWLQLGPPSEKNHWHGGTKIDQRPLTTTYLFTQKSALITIHTRVQATRTGDEIFAYTKTRTCVSQPLYWHFCFIKKNCGQYIWNRKKVSKSIHSSLFILEAKLTAHRTGMSKLLNWQASFFRRVHLHLIRSYFLRYYNEFHNKILVWVAGRLLHLHSLSFRYLN